MHISNSSKCWIIIFVSLIAGTALGIFFQQFAVTAPLFKNFVNFTFSVKEINLIFVHFGLLFGLKINLGTIIGALIGILASR